MPLIIPRQSIEKNKIMLHCLPNLLTRLVKKLFTIVRSTVNNKLLIIASPVSLISALNVQFMVPQTPFRFTQGSRRQTNKKGHFSSQRLIHGFVKQSRWFSKFNGKDEVRLFEDDKRESRPKFSIKKLYNKIVRYDKS